MFKLTKATMPQAMRAVCNYYWHNHAHLWRNMPREWRATAAATTGVALTKAQLLRVLNALVADGRCSRSKAYGLMHYTIHDLDQRPTLAMPGTIADTQFMLDEQPDHVLRMVRKALAKRNT